MNEKTLPITRAYVLRLHAAQSEPDARPSGRLEHVASGRRCEFDSGAALLDWLYREQDLALAEKASIRQPQPTQANP
jgi:hypothetical protein